MAISSYKTVKFATLSDCFYRQFLQRVMLLDSIFPTAGQNTRLDIGNLGRRALTCDLGLDPFVRATWSQADDFLDGSQMLASGKQDGEARISFP